MNKLHKAYEARFGAPDTLITLTSEDDKITFDLAVADAIPDEDMPDSAVTSLGISDEIEFFTEIEGDLSEETVNGIGAAYYSLSVLVGKEIIPGTIYPLSIPPFDNMEAVMIMDRTYDRVEWLNEEEGTSRIIRLIPLYKEEADALEAVEPSLRTRLLLTAEISHTDPAREPEKIIHEAFHNVWTIIADWYQENNVALTETLTAALEADESNAGDALEKKLGFQLAADFKASFDIVHEEVRLEDYITFTEAGILKRVESMNKLNSEGEYKNDTGKIKDDAHVQKTWWHERWIPVAMNSAGDRIVIDMAPGKDGTEGQVLLHSKHEGPLYKNYRSFFDYLVGYAGNLRQDVYQVDEEGFISRN